MNGMYRACVGLLSAAVPAFGQAPLSAQDSLPPPSALIPRELGRVMVDVLVPECQRRFCTVEARTTSEPDNAVPLDLTEATHLVATSLYLPRGVDLRIVLLDRAGLVLREITRRVPNGEEARALEVELIEMARVDQENRDVEAIMQLPRAERQAFMAAAARADSTHLVRLKAIVNRHGWPTAAIVGAEAAHAAFLLLQHADHDPSFQGRLLPVLEAAAARGELLPRDVAYLTDRVRVKEGRPQVYGTQYEPVLDSTGVAVVDGNGKLKYLPPVVADVERLDARRHAVGLGPWIEYERSMAKVQGREPLDAPRAATER